MSRKVKPASDLEVGSVHSTNKYGDLVIIEYENSSTILVRFLETGYETIVSGTTIRKGLVKDRLAKSVLGVACIGSDIKIANKEGKQDPSYTYWTGLIERCYKVGHIKYPSNGGKGHTVCEDWLNYSKFKPWYDENYKKGLEMLLRDGELVYSPDTVDLVKRFTRVGMSSTGRNKRVKK